MPVRIDASFPGGGVDQVRFLSETEIEFCAPLDESPQSLWYCFRVEGARGKTLRFHQRGLDRVLGMFESRGYAPVVPVVRQGDTPWRRLPEGNVFFSEAPLSHSFLVHVEADDCRVAFCYPYQWQDFAALVERLPAQYVCQSSLGLTAEHRNYPCYLISDFESSQEKRMITLFARSHAGEVSGSYVLEGFLAALLGDDRYRPLLQESVFCVFPMVDLDSVESGRYGKDRYPMDFNRDWSDLPYHQEIRLLQQKIEELARTYQPLAFLDLHAPQPGAPSYMPPGGRQLPHSPGWEQMWRFAMVYENLCAEAGLSFHLDDVDVDVLRWGGALRDSMVSAWLQSKFNCLAACFEFSYHRTSEGALLTPDIWRAMGRALLEACVSMPWEGEQPAPEEARIPAWAVPERYQHWQPLNPKQNVEIQEEGRTLHLRPTAAENHLWLSSLGCFPCDSNETLLEIRAEAPTEIQVYLSYFRQGIFLANGKTQACYMDKEPLTVQSGTHPGADGCLVVVRMENFGAPVSLRFLQEAQGTRA